MRAITDCIPLIIRKLSIVLLAWIFCSNVALAAPASEAQTLTIAFLYNFMKLSEWPAEVSTKELTLCVTEAREFGEELDSIKGKPIQNKTLTVKRLVLGDNPSGCQLLFLPSEEKPIRMREWLKLIENKPVLTVSDVTGFLDQGGMVNLVSEDNRLQFEVNLELVEKTGIEMSSQMLKIAREVRGK
jgi:YfiR/HmsC-like